MSNTKKIRTTLGSKISHNFIVKCTCEITSAMR